MLLGFLSEKRGTGLVRHVPSSACGLSRPDGLANHNLHGSFAFGHPALPIGHFTTIQPARPGRFSLSCCAAVSFSIMCFMQNEFTT